jgi:hypothetical protein
MLPHDLGQGTDGFQPAARRPATPPLKLALGGGLIGAGVNSLHCLAQSHCSPRPIQSSPPRLLTWLVCISIHRRTLLLFRSMRSQALERAQGWLKMPDGRALSGFADDYKPHGTTRKSRHAAASFTVVCCVLLTQGDRELSSAAPLGFEKPER